MPTYPRPSQCFHCGCWLIYNVQVHQNSLITKAEHKALQDASKHQDDPQYFYTHYALFPTYDVWRIHYDCPGCQLGQFGPSCYYGEEYSQEEAEALRVQQNLLQETEAAREAVRSWRDQVQRRDAPYIQRFWELFDATFPYWKDKVQHLALTPEHTASMDKHLYCLMFTFYSRAPDGSLNWEIRAEVERWGIRLDPMHQHHDRDRDPNYIESALQEIKEYFEHQWMFLGGTKTLEAYLDTLVLEAYQSTLQNTRAPR